jgi:hypothetical protein
MTQAADAYVTQQPITDATQGEPMYQMKDIMSKLNIGKLMNDQSLGDSLKEKGKGRKAEEYNLGTNSGYRWVLHREPLAEQLRKMKKLSNYSNPDQGEKASNKTTPAISKASLKTLIKHLPSKGVSTSYKSSKKPPQKLPTRWLPVLRSLHGIPILISISPTFKAHNMGYASVVGYDFKSLLKHRIVIPLGPYFHKAANKTSLHHIVKRSYWVRNRHHRFYHRRWNRSIYRRVRRRRYRKVFVHYRRPVHGYRKPYYRKRNKWHRARKRTYIRKYVYKKKYIHRLQHAYSTGKYNGGYGQAYWTYLQKYYPKIYLHYHDGTYKKGNYIKYYRTYLSQYLPSHVKGYNQKGYRLGSYKAGIDYSSLKKPPPPPKKPKTFRYKTDKPHLGKNSCPYAWLKYEGSCYYFSRDELSWYKAAVGLFVYLLFYVSLKIISPTMYMETSPFPVKGCRIYARRSGPLIRDGSLSCHSCFDTGLRFSRSHPKDRPI